MKLTLSILIFGDIFLAWYCHALGYLLRFGQLSSGDRPLPVFGLEAVLFALILVLSGFFMELYTPEKSLRKRDLLVKICGSQLVALLLLFLIDRLWSPWTMGWVALCLALLFFGGMQLLWHRNAGWLFDRLGVSQKIAILGGGGLARKVEELLTITRHNYVFSGFINPATEDLAVCPSRIVGHIDQVVETIRREKIKKIVISLSERRGVLPVKDILNCKLGGVAVVDAVSFYERMAGKLLLEDANPSWFIYASGSRVTAFIRIYKRLLDVCLALLVLLITLPLFPLVALAVRLDSPGPIFFRQTRVGENGAVFVIYKFRTMREDAERLSGAVWATNNDPRVTRIGCCLRKVRLDELPQLWNVFKGDMSFVGPRPERPEFVEQLQEQIPFYANRHCVKPGITGWAQVRYSYGASVEDAMEKLRYDLFYVKNISLFFDLLIVLETVKVVFLTRGAR